MSSKLDEHEEEIFDMLAEGADIKDVADRFGVHRNSIRNWVKAGGEDRKSRYESAMEENAEWHVEQSGEILTEAWTEKDISPARSVIAREMSKRHQWIAEKRNRRLYGEQPTQLNVGLNIGTMHLDALRQANAPKLIPAVEVKELPSET